MQYLKIMESLNEKIETGELAGGTKLPAERKLADAFNTSRITLREALASLESDGKVFREDRRGWFVSPAPLAYDPTCADNFVTMASKAKRQAHSSLLAAESIACPRPIANLLKIEPLSPVYRIERLRYLDNRPVAVTVNYIIADYFPDLLSQSFVESLTASYQRLYQVHYHKTRFLIRSTSLQGDTAQALRARPGSPAMLVERVNFDQDNRLIDCDLEYWRHDAICIASDAELTQKSD